MPTATITEKFLLGSANYEKTNTYSDSASLIIEEAIADSTTDGLVACVVDVSEIAAVFIVSDQAVTLEFNNSGTGEPEIVLVANEPYIWHTASVHTNLLDTDITALYVTNASGSTANVALLFVYDSTP